MWDRAELKKLGKASFKKAYGTAVAVCLILSIISGIFTSANNSVNKNQQPQQVQQYENTTYTFLNITDKTMNFSLPVSASSGASVDGINNFTNLITHGAAFAVIIIALCAIFASFILRTVFLLPLAIGSNRFFMELRDNENSTLNSILYIYKQGKLGNAIFIMLLMNVYIFLWSLLLLIPGIIKTYEYRMVPYILSENPGIKPRQAFKLSKEMMTENKMDSFVLDLSFIGWYLLSLLTLGILNVLYVNPYVAATNAELYSALREDVLNRGIADEMDLPGFGKIYTLDGII